MILTGAVEKLPRLLYSAKNDIVGLMDGSGVRIVE